MIGRYRRGRDRRWVRFMPIVITIAALAAGVILARMRDQPLITDSGINQYAPPGESSYGLPVDLIDNVRVDPAFEVMHALAGCSWGRPGANPWRGDNYSALLAMNVPARTARSIAKRIGFGLYTAHVAMTNKTIEADNGLAFGPWFSMTFANSICYGTRANFIDDAHVERGQLYQDAGYSIFVPNACGNITRLIPLEEATRNHAMKAPLLVPGIPREAQPYVPAPGIGKAQLREDNVVPEPAEWALFAIGVAIFAAMRKRRTA